MNTRVSPGTGNLTNTAPVEGNDVGDVVSRPKVKLSPYLPALLLAMIEMRLSLTYPAPVRALTREVRRHVIERVTGLTGLEVRHVDIEVARLLRGRNR